MILSKIEQALVDRAGRNGGSSSVEIISGRGPKGGRVAHGARERAALFRLAALGVVTITQRHADTDYNSGHGIHCTSLIYRLTGH